MIKALLPVVDDVDRALAAMEKSDDVEALRGGVRLIAQKFNEVMRQQGVNEIKLTNVEGYDNSTYKSINVDYLAWKLIPAEEPVVAE